MRGNKSDRRQMRGVYLIMHKEHSSEDFRMDADSKAKQMMATRIGATGHDEGRMQEPSTEAG